MVEDAPNEAVGRGAQSKTKSCFASHQWLVSSIEVISFIFKEGKRSVGEREKVWEEEG